MYKSIAFKSQGVLLRGHLYQPIKRVKKTSIVIMAHGFTGTINGMTADKYAERFYEAGFAVLLYDHINLGNSDGEPRQEINFLVQTRGYIDALDFVCNLPNIDTKKIALWGCSLSTREVILASTIDKRVKAIITQAPAFGDEMPANNNNAYHWAEIHKLLTQNNLKSLEHTVEGPMPIVSSDPSETTALNESTALEWFMKYGEEKSTNWKNTVTIIRPTILTDFHFAHCIPHLRAAVLMVVPKHDEMSGCSSNISREVFNSINQPKEKVEIDGGHFGLLHYPSPVFETSSNAQIAFLQKIFIS